MRKYAVVLLCVTILGCGALVRSWRPITTPANSPITVTNHMLVDGEAQVAGILSLPTNRELFGWLLQSATGPWALTFEDAEQLF